MRVSKQTIKVTKYHRERQSAAESTSERITTIADMMHTLMESF
jgi:hypothetical protein